MCNYLPETDDTNNWNHYPFHALPPVHLLISEQEKPIEIATSGSAKIDLWIGHRSGYSAVANRTVKTPMPFATMYLCESGLSALTSMKSKYRHRLCVEYDLRLRLSNTTQHCSVMCIISSTPFSLTCGELFTIFEEQIRFYM